MTCTLRLHFIGACVVARDEAPPAGRVPALHVILPRFDGEHQNGSMIGVTAPPYHARLRVRSRHLETGANDAGVEFATLNLDAASIDLLELTPAGTRLPALHATLPASFVALGEIAGMSGLTHVDRSVIDGVGHVGNNAVQSRVTLRAGHGSTTLSPSTPHWTNEFDLSRTAWQGQLASHLTWEIGGLPTDARLSVRIRNLDGTLRDTVRLLAVRDVIEMFVTNAPDELQPVATAHIRRGRGYRANGFEAYYQLFSAAPLNVTPALVHSYESHIPEWGPMAAVVRALESELTPLVMTKVGTD